MFLAVTLLANSQTKVNNNDLPILAKEDTLILDECWIESVDSEMNQRAMIMRLENRITQTLEILHKKKGFESQIDSLITEAVNIQRENDSLMNVITIQKVALNKKIENRIRFLSTQIDSIKNQYFEMRKSRNKWRKNTFLSLGLNVIFVILLL